nr:Toll/interleukin-1 receptor (TIR) domain-containing protein [Tanacetum cinerariifolium]
MMMDQSHTADVITIWGMDGIGKTSLARFVYDVHFTKFKPICFIGDISRKCKDKYNGLLELHKIIYNEISNKRDIQGHDVAAYTSAIGHALTHKKVFLVLDDIDSIEQLNALLGKKDNSAQAQKHFLKTLDEDASLKLLCRHAFKYEDPKEGYEEVLDNILKYYGGLSLALQEELRWLCMYGFPLKSIPLDLLMKYLVALDISYCNFESFDVSCSNPQPLEGGQMLTGSCSKDDRLVGSLKILDLIYCYKLNCIASFCELPTLENLFLRNCTSLIEVSVGFWENEMGVTNLPFPLNLDMYLVLVHGSVGEYNLQNKHFAWFTSLLGPPLLLPHDVLYKEKEPRFIVFSQKKSNTHGRAIEDSEVMKGLSECKASKSNVRRIQVKDIVKEVEDHLKTYSSARIDISCFKTTRDPIMSGTLPPIPPPLETSIGSPISPNVNRFDTIPNVDPTNTTTTNVARNVVEENNDNLPQLLDSRGGSHFTNIPAFNKDDFASWKIRFLVFLNGLEPYLITTLEDGPFVPMCLPNDVMKSIIKYKSAIEMWTELCLAYEGPSDTRDIKLAALRLKFNDFKALEDSDSDVEEDNRTNNEFMVDLNVEYHVRALVANQKRFYKRFARVGSARKPMDKSKETCFTYENPGHFQKDCPSNKTSTPSYPSSNTSFNKPKPYTPSFTPNISQNSSNHQKDYKGKYEGLKVEMDDEGTTMFKAFMAIAEDEPSVGMGDARSGQWVEITMKKTYSKVTLDQLLSKKIPGNIVKALGGKGRRKENNSQKEVLFTKSDVSTSDSAPMITSDFEDDYGNHVSLPPLPKITKVEPSDASKRLISLSGLTANMANLTLNTTLKEIKKSFNKVSQTYVIKKKTKPKHPGVQTSSPNKNALQSTKQLLLTLMEKVKGIKNQILIPSNTSSSVSQEMEETFHVTFSEDNEAISQSSTEGDAININEVRSFHDDEFNEPRTSDTLCNANIEYFPYVPTFDRLSINIHVSPEPEITSSPLSSSTSEDSPVPNLENEVLVLDEPLHQINLPLADSVSDPPIPRDRWSREKHIDLVNIIGEPFAVIITRSRIRDSDAALASECLYVNFLSEIEPKNLIEDLKEEAWVLAMTKELNQFERNKMDMKSAFLNGKISEEVYVERPPRYQANPKESHLVAIKIIFRYLKAEAEYVVVAGCCAQIIWIKSQLADYDVLYDKVPIFCDNTSSIAISNNSVLHSRTKYIDIRYHFIRDHILKGDIELHFVPTDLQLAFIFTKPLAEPSFTRLVAELEEPEQTLLPPSREVNADDTADKSLSRTSLQTVTQPKAPTAKNPRKKKIPSLTQPKVSNDSRELLQQPPIFRVQDNQPKVVDATEEKAEEQSLEFPLVEHLLDEVDNHNKFVQESKIMVVKSFLTSRLHELQVKSMHALKQQLICKMSTSDHIIQDDNASTERMSLLDHMDHICEEVGFLHSKLGDMESSVAGIKSSLPTLKELSKVIRSEVTKKVQVVGLEGLHEDLHSQIKHISKYSSSFQIMQTQLQDVKDLLESAVIIDETAKEEKKKKDENVIPALTQGEHQIAENITTLELTPKTQGGLPSKNQKSQLLPEMNLKGKAKSLGLPPPPELANFRLTDKEKKRKRAEFVKEVFVNEDVRVDGMGKNLISPPGVIPIQGLVISKPELGIFFMNGNTNIKVAEEMFKKMIYVIEARSDCNKARDIVEKNLDNRG